MREAVWAGVQNTSLGTHRFAMESPPCLMTVISTFIRYSEADTTTSELFLKRFYCAVNGEGPESQLH